MKEWWKMAIFHFKHSYLNWRVISCRRRMICVYAAFHHFLNIFLASWFSFRLSRIFQVHDMTINFSFCSCIHSFFLFFFEWSTLGNVACHGWSSCLKHIFSYEDRFERVHLLVQKVVHIICPKKRVWLRSVLFVSARK